MDEKQRAESVRHCKWVDEVVENSPWVLDQAFIDKHQVRRWLVVQESLTNVMLD
jgi:glycerol-3-phosphate cytidylyltransferase-like family protein